MSERARGIGRAAALVAAGVAAAWSTSPARGDRVCVESLPALPEAVANNAVTSVDNLDGTFTLYSFMGITNPAAFQTITAAAHRLDWPGGSWTPIADAPLLNDRAKIGASAVTVAGEVYLIGGYTVGGGPEVTEPRLFRYDPVGDVYVELASVPVEVDDTVPGVYQDRYLYLVSGWHGPLFRNVPNVQVYDVQTNTWAQATPIPNPLPGLFGHAGTIVGDRIIYLDGARMGASFPISDRVFVGRIDPDRRGDVTTIAWEEVDPHPGRPTYRAAASQGATGGARMLLVGGSDNTYNYNGHGYDGRPALPVTQVLAYEPLAGAWAELDVFGDRVPTMDHRGLVRVDDGWATIGGMTAPFTATDAVSLFEVLPDGPPGDLDCDGSVGFADLLIILSTWGPCPDPPSHCPADIDGDGVVGFPDLLIVLANWG
jgi:hypothetical protein